MPLQKMEYQNFSYQTSFQKLLYLLVLDIDSSKMLSFVEKGEHKSKPGRKDVGVIQLQLASSLDPMITVKS